MIGYLVGGGKTSVLLFEQFFFIWHHLSGIGLKLFVIGQQKNLD